MKQLNANWEYDLIKQFKLPQGHLKLSHKSITHSYDNSQVSQKTEHKRRQINTRNFNKKKTNNFLNDCLLGNLRLIKKNSLSVPLLLHKMQLLRWVGRHTYRWPFLLLWTVAACWACSDVFTAAVTSTSISLQLFDDVDGELMEVIIQF